MLEEKDRSASHGKLTITKHGRLKEGQQIRWYGGIINSVAKEKELFNLYGSEVEIHFKMKTRVLYSVIDMFVYKFERK